MPNLTRYRGNKTNSLNMTKAWSNACFGGSVFNALGAYKKGRTRKNTLE
jgi:hypothetical protein